MSDLNQIKATLDKLSSELVSLGDYIKNYIVYYQSGRATMPLDDAKYRYNVIANDYKQLEATYNATIMAYQQNQQAMSGMLGGINLTGGVAVPSRGLNSPDSGNYSTTSKGLKSFDDNTMSRNNNVTVTENKVDDILKSIGELKPMNTTLPNMVQIAEPEKPYYFLEKDIVVGYGEKEDGSDKLNGLSSLDEIKITKLEQSFVINPLFTTTSNNNSLVVTNMRKIYLNNVNDSFTPYLNRDFSSIAFSEVINLNSSEFILYHYIKDIIKEYMAILFKKPGGNPTCITDIKNVLSSKDLSVKSLNFFRDIFMNMALRESTNEDAKKNIPGLLELDIGGNHIYFNSSRIDLENLLKIETGKKENKLLLTEESYKNLYLAIKTECAPHGVLELIQGIKYRYFVTEDKIILKRIRDLA